MKKQTNYLYQKYNGYTATIPEHTFDIVSQELRALGATDVRQGYRSAMFTATPEVLYRINYCSRLIINILAPILTFDCHSAKYLYKQASTIAWTDFLSLETTFAIRATTTHSSIRHSKYAALKLKDAIVDQFRETTGQRPDVDTDNPDLTFNLYIQKNRATISVVTNGASLHRRGYRSLNTDAPMQENLAASILAYTGWDGSTPLHDPMCGSGTLLAEAALQMTGRPAASLRSHFSLFHLPDFNKKLWHTMKVKADNATTPIPTNTISGSDISSHAIKASRTNLNPIDPESAIGLRRCDIHTIPDLNNTTIVCNPPYGLRMGSEEPLEEFYKKLGDFLKQRCNGSTAYIYFGNREMIKHIGLRTSFKKILFNGAIDGRLVKIDLY